jgi:steroid delta-isomerase-like uncharacterized protein
MPDTTPAADVTGLLDRYGAAWNGHDLDAIMAEHTPESVFHLHAGAPEAVGSTAVREAFAATLEQWPDIHFAAEDVRIGPDHVTLRWTVTATLATPLDLPDSGTAAPSGRQVRFDAVDVLVIDGGRIARKDTYVDSLSLQQQLAEHVPAAA